VVVVGDVAMDVVALPHGPIAYGTDTPAEVATRPAGAGANVAVALAAAGVEVVSIARVGDDAPGRALRAHVEAAGVRCVWAVDRDRPTGMVVVLVDEDGERTMLPGRGANAALRADDVVAALDVLGAWGGSWHVHLSGYVLLDAGSRPAGLAALAAAHRRGWTTSVDPQAAALVAREGAPAFLDWVRGADLLLPNAGEFTALGGEEAILGAVAAVAVTDGPRGARWVTRDGIHPIRYAVPAEPLEATGTTGTTDTTGAGDAFDAGLLAAWLAGADPATALADGVAAATRQIARASGRREHG